MNDQKRRFPISKDNRIKITDISREVSPELSDVGRSGWIKCIREIRKNWNERGKPHDVPWNSELERIFECFSKPLKRGHAYKIKLEDKEEVICIVRLIKIVSIRAACSLDNILYEGECSYIKTALRLFIIKMNNPLEFLAIMSNDYSTALREWVEFVDEQIQEANANGHGEKLEDE